MDGHGQTPAPDNWVVVWPDQIVVEPTAQALRDDRCFVRRRGWSITMSSLETVERPTTALLADDDPSLRPYLSLVLQQQGFIVLSACNGDEALTIFREFPGTVDLLITDVHMGEGPDRRGIGEAASATSGAIWRCWSSPERPTARNWPPETGCRFSPNPSPWPNSLAACRKSGQPQSLPTKAPAPASTVSRPGGPSDAPAVGGLQLLRRRGSRPAAPLRLVHFEIRRHLE